MHTVFASPFVPKHMTIWPRRTLCIDLAPFWAGERTSERVSTSFSEPFDTRKRVVECELYRTSTKICKVIAPYIAINRRRVDKRSIAFYPASHPTQLNPRYLNEWSVVLWAVPVSWICSWPVRRSLQPRTRSVSSCSTLWLWAGRSCNRPRCLPGRTGLRPCSIPLL